MRATATRLCTALLAPLLLAAIFLPSAHAQSITVDPTFGTNGFVLETFDSDRAGALGLERLPDGRLIVLGSRAGNDYLAARYLPDGTLDPSFGGGDGWVSIAMPRPAPFGPAAGSDAARAGNGAVSLHGSSGGGFYVHSQGLNQIFRFTPDGMVDASFGDGGTATISDTRLFRIHDVAEGIDGTVWVTGFGRDAANSIRRFLLIKLTPNGQLDTDYGEGGFALFGDVDALAYDLLVQPDGRLVLAGSLYPSSMNSGLAAARFTPDGALDPSFGDGGFFSVPDFASVESVALQPDGRLLLAGTLQSGSTSDFYIARLTADGALDPSFDGDGSRVFNVGTSESFTGVTMNADGSPVTEFGFEGVSTFFFGPGPGWFSPVWDFAVLPNGQVVAIGSARRQGFLPVIGVTRLDLSLSFNDGDEVLDPDYGEGGIVEADLGGLGGGDDTAEVTLDLPDGGLLTIGTCASCSVETRSRSTEPSACRTGASSSSAPKSSAASATSCSSASPAPARSTRPLAPMESSAMPTRIRAIPARPSPCCPTGGCSCSPCSAPRPATAAPRSSASPTAARSTPRSAPAASACSACSPTRRTSCFSRTGASWRVGRPPAASPSSASPTAARSTPPSVAAGRASSTSAAPRSSTPSSASVTAASPPPVRSRSAATRTAS
jgi:uncharacterized delta-60 repeat protein